MKLAIVADWLTVFGGAEHVIAEFHALWPEAPIFTTVARRERLGPLSGADIRTSRLQWIYRILKRHQLLVASMPLAIERFDLSAYDVVLSSSHAIGKGVVPRAHAVHICYCHTPMRYAWEMEREYLEDFRVPRALQSPIKKRLKQLRRWDLTTAQRVDRFIANSRETEERIARIYGRKSTVLHPPVHDRFFSTPQAHTHRKGFLALGRLVPYKRFDLLIALANRERMALTIVGTGQEEARLKALAGGTVTFAGFVPDEALARYYDAAEALLFPTHEDAGLVPLEAQARGTPVIAYQRGGALDSIADGVTGLFFHEQSLSSLADALARCRRTTWDHEAIRKHAEQFNAARFRERLQGIIAEEIERKRKHEYAGVRDRISVPCGESQRPVRTGTFLL